MLVAFLLLLLLLVLVLVVVCQGPLAGASLCKYRDFDQPRVAGAFAAVAWQSQVDEMLLFGGVMKLYEIVLYSNSILGERQFLYSDLFCKL